jgi:hypothetical protein
MWTSCRLCFPHELLNGWTNLYEIWYEHHRGGGRGREEATLLLTISQSVYLGIEHPFGTCEQILLPVGMLLSEICGLVSVERPLWREDGSEICSVIAQWSDSRLLYDWRSISQHVLEDLRPDITSCRNVAVWNLRSCFCGAPSLPDRMLYSP